MSRIRARFYDPEGTRHHRTPTFWWQGAPPQYATRRQLRKDGLQPGRQPVAAQIRWMGVGGERFADLYLIALAKPKRPASLAQLAAVAKALAARRTCPTCGTVRDHCIPRSLGECFPCFEASQRREVA